MPVIKAICVRQPWANMIAEDIKRIEVRSWPTSYRGPLVICASRTKVDCGPNHPGPFGVELAIVYLEGCRRLEPGDEVQSHVPYKPGMWAWQLRFATMRPPAPVRGRLGFFHVMVDRIPRRKGIMHPFRGRGGRW